MALGASLLTEKRSETVKIFSVGEWPVLQNSVSFFIYTKLRNSVQKEQIIDYIFSKLNLIEGIRFA